MIMAKKNVFQQYEKEIKNINRTPVSLSTFITTWNAIFPRCVNRPWCDIPGSIYFTLFGSITLKTLTLLGKCDICGEIDRQRRTCEDENTLEQLKRAHHMHRGGLFMRERLE
jgi:hypothetical protein